MAEETSDIYDEKKIKIDEEYLDDLRRVGSLKPLGYLPLPTIRACGGDVKALISEAHEKGHLYKVLSEEECEIDGGALFIADPVGLKTLLSKNKEIIESSGWEIDPEAFVYQVATRRAPKKTKLFDIISDAFADKTNPGRTDVEEGEVVG